VSHEHQLLGRRLGGSSFVRTLRTTTGSPSGGMATGTLTHQDAGLLKRLVSGVDVDSLTDRDSTRVTHGFKVVSSASTADVQGQSAVM
jgi:hypothetical protein